MSDIQDQPFLTSIIHILQETYALAREIISNLSRCVLTSLILRYLNHIDNSHFGSDDNDLIQRITMATFDDQQHAKNFLIKYADTKLFLPTADNIKIIAIMFFIGYMA